MIMDNNQTTQEVPASSPAPMVPIAPVFNAPLARNSPRKPIKITLLIVALLLSVSAAGYFAYKQTTTNRSLQETQKSLRDTKAALESVPKQAAGGKTEKEFITQHNDAALSRSLCSGKSVGMFDVHINDKFAVFRYLCADQSSPIRIAALKQIDGGKYEFTYGAASGRPNDIPDYIFNSEPDFFGPIYGGVKF